MVFAPDMMYIYIATFNPPLTAICSAKAHLECIATKRMRHQRNASELVAVWRSYFILWHFGVGASTERGQ